MIPKQARIYSLVLLSSISIVIGGCHATLWNEITDTNQLVSPPAVIATLFDKAEGNTIKLNALSPGFDYSLDVGEKDAIYGMHDQEMRFRTVELRLLNEMPRGKVLADITFIDGTNNRVVFGGVDLLRLVPKTDMEGELIYPEFILDELNRFGVSFRNEHQEFELNPSYESSPQAIAAFERVYRASITNNCLAPGNWEFAIVTEDYSDFKTRRNGDINLNQNRLLAHSWFQVEPDLYRALFNLKNPGKDFPLDMDFDSISNRAEQVVIDFDELRLPLKMKIKTELLEVGHQSNRKIEPVDVEEFYKEQFGLLLSEKNDLTYQSILEKPIKTANFKEAGFYRTEPAKEFNLEWLKYVDSVAINSISVPGTDCYVEITLTGKWSPYNLTIGNVDMAQFDEQKLFGMLFGFNTYPKGRRYNPSQSTISYDAELLPDDIKPYVLLTDKQTGKWVNNQYKGIEKINITYESLEKDVLIIYVLSYERITPVWMARIKLPPAAREMVRIRNSLYNY